MTWEKACRLMVQGKRVRLPHWNRWVSIGFGDLAYLNTTTLVDGCRAFSPELGHLINTNWEESK